MMYMMNVLTWCNYGRISVVLRQVDHILDTLLLEEIVVAPLRRKARASQ